MPTSSQGCRSKSDVPVPSPLPGVGGYTMSPDRVVRRVRREGKTRTQVKYSGHRRAAGASMKGSKRSRIMFMLAVSCLFPAVLPAQDTAEGAGPSQ